MGAELLADLRGLIGIVTNYFGNPLLLYAIVLGIYLIYRKSSS